jgi:very-short-patch-repair endonuclease
MLLRRVASVSCGGMPQRMPLPEPHDAGPFSLTDGLHAGVTAGRLRGSDLLTPFPGVRLLATLDPGRALAARCRLYAPRLVPGQFFSHLSAAALHGLPLPPWADSAPVDVSALDPVRAPRTPGVRAHHFDTEHVELAVVDGLPVTAALETWRHLSTQLLRDDLVAVGDALVRRVNPLATDAQLVRALARHGGRRGIRRLRAAHELVRRGTDSAAETRLRLVLRDAGLPGPEVNGLILADDGDFLAYGDLVYRRRRVVVEYDGRHHRTELDQYEHDIRRLDRLADAGWRVVRVIAEQLADDPQDVAARIRRALYPPIRRTA